jgi:hypothetical protein
MAAVGFPRAEGGLDGVIGEVGEVVLAAGGSVMKNAGSDFGGDDEVDVAVRELEAVGQTYTGDSGDRHSDAPHLRMTKRSRTEGEFIVCGGGLLGGRRLLERDYG